MMVIALLGWVAVAALHRNSSGGILFDRLIGVGLGIGFWRNLSQRARLKRAAEIKAHASIH